MKIKGQNLSPSRRTVLTGLAAGAAVTILGEPAWAWNDRPPQVARQRDRTLLETGWRYVEGEPAGAEQPAFDDGGWSDVTLPHTWNAEDSLDDEAGYRRGPGWYRFAVRVDSRHQGKRLYLYFEGANQVADVFVEGTRVGGHVGGYTAFCVEVSDQLRQVRPGQHATVAVRVDNSHNDDIPPYSADFTFYGGIYRNVWLVATAPVHLTMLDHASPGVRIDTPQASARSASVRVRGSVVNDSTAWADVSVTSTVADAGGREVGKASATLNLAPGVNTEFELRPPALTSPHLWSPDSPYLYKVATVVDDGHGSRDRVDSALGIRWFSVDADTGFYLNGQSLPLRGTNRHQDKVGRGNALTDAEHVADFKLIKEMGCNVVRLAHYPQAPAVLEAADRLGLVIWEETPLVNRITMSQAFTQHSLDMTREMVRQHYNHPSVMLWGYMNEIFLRPPKPEPAGLEEATVALARRLEELVRAEDPTRLTTMAGHQSQRYSTSGIADIPMVFGWNLYPGWYGGTYDELGGWLDAEHAAHPARIHWVSEYGADSDSRLHSVHPTRMDQSIEYQQLFNESYLQQMGERPYLAGTTHWSQFDFGSESRTGSVPHVNTKGLMLSDRTPKDLYYLFQASLGTAPVLHIASRHWSHRAGTAPAAPRGAGPQPVTQVVTVYSNLAQVELFAGGASLGVKAPGTARTARWQVPFVHGTNELTARGRAEDGTVLEDAVEVLFTYQAPVLADPSVPFQRLATSAGAIVQYTDPESWVWVEDQVYSVGGWGAVGGTALTMTDGWVNGSTEDPLYQTYREAMSAYRFDVPGGTYEVTLRFMDPTATAPGQRVIDVHLNGAVLAAGLDLVAQVGPRTAYDVEGRVKVSGGTGLAVGFTARTGMPVVSGIGVRRV